MYNPYNWKINKKPKKICILDQLTEINNKIDMERVQIEKSRKNLDELVEEKVNLLNILSN